MSLVEQLQEVREKVTRHARSARGVERAKVRAQVRTGPRATGKGEREAMNEFAFLQVPIFERVHKCIWRS